MQGPCRLGTCLGPLASSSPHLVRRRLVAPPLPRSWHSGPRTASRVLVFASCLFLFFFFFLFPPFLGSCVQVFARYLPGSQGPVSTGTGLDEVGVPKVTMRLQQLRGPDLDGLDRVMGKGDIDEH